VAEDKKRSFPKIPKSSWFTLREKFKQRVPAEVSPSYVASALSMSEPSASANILPSLRTFGLVLEDGKPSDLAYEWRDDSKYPEVCKEILEKIYPQELLDLFHGPDVQAQDVNSWFARYSKVGESAARMYGTTFLMLLEGDLEKAESKQAKSPRAASQVKQTVRKSTPSQVNGKSTESKIPAVPEAPSENSSVGVTGFTPKLHIDIQIHISPESPPEQIDKIFESMAKHLKDFRA